MYVAAVNPRDAQQSFERSRADRWEWVGQMDWLSDGSALVWSLNSDWRGLSGMAVEVFGREGIKNNERDTNMWPRLGFSSTLEGPVALQRSLTTNVWLIPAGDAEATRVTYGVGGYRGGSLDA